ncbi:MAG TPA: hypothetical protein VLA36_05520 [Longimicrobiales bacterium]|nr:hypothetical protein [Longimicrobiales bacterium]
MMNRLMSRAAVPAAALVLAACRPAPTVERDPAPLLQSDALAYELRRDDVGYSTRIPYTFRNETGGDVVLPNCNGDTRPMLQKERDGRWYDAWEPFMDRCLSPAVVIRAGGTFTDTLDVFGAPPGSNVLPTFVFPEVEGVYRLFWVQARPASDSSGTPDETRRLDMRFVVSNPFVLVR